MATDVRTGWLTEQEDWEFLATETAPVFSAPGDYVPPSVLNFMDKLIVESQLNLGSCVGHMGSTGVEALQWLLAATRIQMSRMGCYLLAQQYSSPPISGDNGAHIKGMVDALTRAGCPTEESFPYPVPAANGKVRYSTYFPAIAKQEMGRYKILGHSPIYDYDGMFAWISQGKGPVFVGMPWFTRLLNLGRDGQVTESHLSGPDVGGHAQCFIGYQGTKGPDGEFILDDINSHGSQWGDRGWSHWTKRTVNKMLSLRDRRGNRLSVAIGVTDITGFDPTRLVNFSKIV